MGTPRNDDGMTTEQMALIATYEMHMDLITDGCREHELGMDHWIKGLSTEQCAFLHRYFSVREDAIDRHSEDRKHEHARRPN